MRTDRTLLVLLTLAGGVARAQMFGAEDIPPTSAPPVSATPAPASAAAPAVVPAVASPAALPAPGPAAPTLPASSVIEDRKAVEELDAASREFEREVQDYRGDVQFTIERRFQQAKERIKSSFERGIREVEREERKERLSAIELFERFIARHPNDPKYTPDAMTRLAELYYEKAVDDQQLALADFEEKVKMGAGDAAPPEIVRSFDKSIALYRTIIERFPDYRLNDSIYYLLGWCLSEQGEDLQARDTFAALIQKFPTSRYVPESWVRIGEYYFDYQGDDVDDKLKLAVEAYGQATKYKDSPLFDKALYKLGWAHYRRNDFDNGVDAFVRLVDYYDAKKAAGDEAGGDLRAEALQYTAVSYADDNWGGTEAGTDRFLGVEKMAKYFKRIGGRPYEHELFRRLGDVLFDTTKYAAAIEAYRNVLERKPYAPDAPQIHEKIVQAFARDQKREEAFAERARLVQAYSEHSEWAKQNQGNQDVLIAARDLVERNLLATAQYHHQQALEYEKAVGDPSVSPERAAQLPVLIFKSFQNAAAAYGDYLKEFPHSKNLYDIQYFHAETLYNSLQFLAAAEEYAKVRDSNTDNKYLANAAYSTVLSLQREIERQEKQGLLEPRAPCDPVSCASVTDFSPQAIPPLRLKLIEAADIYMAKIPTAEDAHTLSFKAGQTYFTYFHFEEARKRYEDVIKRFPDKEVAEYAYNDILISYLLTKDWLNVEQFADRMLKESKAIQSDDKKVSEKRLLKYGARFKRANAAMEQKKWEEAAQLYMSIVDETEAEEAKWGLWADADKALFNAAACFKEFRKFDSAMRTYERLFTKYEKSPLAESALFFVAAAAEKAFEFDKAIKYYQRLVEEYPKSKDRVAAQFNVAMLLEAMRRYSEAAAAYTFYSKEFKNESDAPDMAYKAALIYQRRGDQQNLIKALEDFIKTYQSKDAQFEKVTQAHAKIALAYRKLGNETSTRKWFDDTVKYYNAKGLRIDTHPAAAQAASEARFNQVEVAFAEFKTRKFDPKGRGKKLEQDTLKQLNMLAEQLEKVKQQYTEVIVKYRWPEWITASLLRLGEADEAFARKLLDSPCPTDIRSEFGEEGCDAYKIQLEEMVAPIMDRAIAAFETASDKAAELRIVNEWTKRNMERVCEFSPAKCKSLKEPRGNLITDGHSPRPLVGADGTSAVAWVGGPVAPKPPVVTDVQPRQVLPGGSFVIVGDQFGQDAASVTVTLGGTELLVREVSSQRVVTIVPSGAAKGPLTVKTAGGSVVTPFVVEIAPAAIGTPSLEPGPAAGGGAP